MLDRTEERNIELRLTIYTFFTFLAQLAMAIYMVHICYYRYCIFYDNFGRDTEPVASALGFVYCSNAFMAFTLGSTRTSLPGQTRVTNGGGPLTTRTSDGAQTVISTTPTGVFQSSTPMGPCGQAQALAATAAATVNNAATESLAEISLAAGGLSKNDAIVSDATSRIAAAVQDAQTAMDSAVATAETACMAAGNDQTAINAANAAAVTSINAAQAAAVTSITATRDAAVTAIQAN
ncbi:hypothetical protein Ddc_16748 [Ditylenchus destructor]|nr:hypothetical protein Ddc_16748 [Ditylenchus destructor]